MEIRVPLYVKDGEKLNGITETREFAGEPDSIQGYHFSCWLVRPMSFSRPTACLLQNFPKRIQAVVHHRRSAGALCFNTSIPATSRASTG